MNFYIELTYMFRELSNYAYVGFELQFFNVTTITIYCQTGNVFKVLKPSHNSLIICSLTLHVNAFLN